MDEGQRKMESLNLTRFAAVALPRFVKMRQHFKKERIGDIAKEVRTQLAPHLTNLQGKRIAIGIGSRGIANIKEIAKTLVDEWKYRGNFYHHRQEALCYGWAER